MLWPWRSGFCRRRVAIVIGHGAEAVRQAYDGAAVAWAIQEKQLGTGHAVLCAKDVFDGFAGEVLILSGDVPLIREANVARHGCAASQPASRRDIAHGGA